VLVHLEAVKHQPSWFGRGCVNIFQFLYIITDPIPRHNLVSLPLHDIFLLCDCSKLFLNLPKV
jgi:hypothetical protein